LVVLEGLLSVDNALVLGLLAKKLPDRDQKKALTYGLVGALAFRIIAIGGATFLLQWTWVKVIGGGYLLYVPLKHWWDARRHSRDGSALKPPSGGFWWTVLVIELTDIAFAIDSILAAIAVVGPGPAEALPGTMHPKLWVVVLGGILGVVMMRFAAALFIRLLERFPRFETAAYVLVLVIGLKLLIDYVGNDLLYPGTHAVNFHSPASPWFWAFWGLMLATLASGFLGSKKPLVAAKSA
jgi:YkoY family integral membrane protein